MYKIIILTLALCVSYPIFAEDLPPDEATSSHCESIAKACTAAGFTRDGEQGKMFWKDCMKPILFGQQVSGVTVDAKDVSACRSFKIKNLQEQINELKKHQAKTQ